VRSFRCEFLGVSPSPFCFRCRHTVVAVDPSLIGVPLYFDYPRKYSPMRYSAGHNLALVLLKLKTRRICCIGKSWAEVLHRWDGDIFP